MSEKYKLIKNKAGRMIPKYVNGVESIPYKGVGKHFPNTKKASPSISS